MAENGGRGIVHQESVADLLKDGTKPRRESVVATQAATFRYTELPARHNRDHGNVEIVSWRGQWAKTFVQDANLLRDALGPDVFEDAQHVGSTSCEGLVAKNIVDILLSVSSLEGIDSRRGELEAAGFIWCGEPIPGGRYLYSMGKHGHVQSHVHVTPVPLTPNSQAVLHFRDALRSNVLWRTEYGALKERLAGAHAADRIRYTKEKTEFIKVTLGKYKY